MTQPKGLLNREFIALNGIAFFTYCNLAIFFEFHDYLSTLPIPSMWIGFLIGAFSLTAFIVRPDSESIDYRSEFKKVDVHKLLFLDCFLNSL